MLALTTVLIAAARGSGDAGPKRLALNKIGDFDQPVYVAQPPNEGDLLFVVEKPGTIRVLVDEKVEPQPFLDLTENVKEKGSEQGLLSIAFAPDYAESGLFYVAYTGKQNGLRIEEYERGSTKLVADPASGREVLTIPQNSDRHHSGMLVFGPDRNLFVGSGDGGPSFDPFRTGQDKGTLLGKMLRIDPKQSEGQAYTIPDDNPFVGRRGRDEIYAYGLRNPWRFSFDRVTDKLAIGDVGQDRFEEVDMLDWENANGANFGWSAYEAFGALYGGVARKQVEMPVFAYPRGRKGACAVTGGYIVRDGQLARLKGREVLGRYIFGDFCTGQIRAFRPPVGKGKPGRDHTTGLRVELLSSFGEDRAGHIYVTSLSGPVYRIVATRQG